MGICNCAFFCAEGTIGTGRGGRGGFRVEIGMRRGEVIVYYEREDIVWHLVGASISERLMRHDTSYHSSRDFDKINSTTGRGLFTRII